MNQKRLLNIALSLALLGLSGANIITRSSLNKIGLSFLTIGIVSITNTLQSQINERERQQLESQIKSLKAQIGMLQIEVEQQEKVKTELEQKHQTELVDLRQSQRQEIAKATMDNVQTFEQKITLLNRKHQLKFEQLKANHEGELKASDEIIGLLRQQKEKLQGNVQALQQELESFKDDMARQIQSLEREREDFEHDKKRLEISQNELQKQKKLMAESVKLEQQKLQSSHFQSTLEVQKLQLDAKTELDKTKAENEVLRQRLAQVSQAYSKNNGRYNLTSLEGFTANAIERFFARQQLPVSYLQGEEVKTQDRLSLKFAAKEENKAKIIKLADALSADVFSGKPVSIRRKDGYLIIDVPLEDRIDMGTVSNPENQSHTHLNEFTINSNHFLVMGATGDGKSAMVSNLLELAGQILTNPEVLFLNPKPTGVNFYFRGKKLQSDFLNLETPSGCTTPNCGEGLQHIDYILSERMATAQRIEEKNHKLPEDQQIPFPKFDPLLIVIDECQALRSENDQLKELFGKVSKKLARLGREYNLISVLIGQDTTCGEWGFRSRSQFQCFSRLYFASVLNISSVITQEIKFLPNTDEVLKSIEEFKSKRSSVKTDPHNFYALFIRQGNAPGYVAYLPKPNYFHKQDSDKLHCPSCGSQEVVKNGIKHDKQNYSCKGCKTQFTGGYVDTHSEDLAGIS